MDAQAFKERKISRTYQSDAYETSFSILHTPTSSTRSGGSTTDMCLTIIFARPSKKTRNFSRFPRLRRVPFTDIIGDPMESPVMTPSISASEDGDRAPLLRNEPERHPWTAHHRSEIMSTQRHLREPSVAPMTPQRSVSASQGGSFPEVAFQSSPTL